MNRIFIDGREGTTGLRICERLSGRGDIELIILPEELRKDVSARAEAINASDITFLCLPDATAREAVGLVSNPRTRVIDSSTAHRTADGWAYGFPELSPAHLEAIANADRVSVPGCHASGFVSLVYPLVAAGLLPSDAALCCHSITGYSGGGKKMIAQYEQDDHGFLLDAPRQYALGQTHKHLPEMAARTGLEQPPLFCPIVADYYSGMLVTVPLLESQLRGSAADVINVYKELYAGPVVSWEQPGDFAPDGTASAIAMSGLDGMEITVTGENGRLLLMSRFDNLGKGASGAAVQCMNLMLGLDGTTGLSL